MNAEINVVSLIDVILLLLLIFMITAPMMTTGLDITLPTADVQPLESRDAVVVEVDKSGRLFVDGKSWTEDELRGALPAYLRGRDHVTLRGDTEIDYGVIVNVMGILSVAGVRGFNMAALQAPSGR